MNKGSGCNTCPVNDFDCDAQYRGSRCAALRAGKNADFDPQTNADFIRGMSDEELAEFLSNVYFGGFDDGLHRPPRVEKTLYTTDWLRQPKEHA